MTNYRAPTEDEVAALEAFAHETGKRWKSVLTDTYWYNARIWRDRSGDDRHGYTLHSIRNTFGPSWLYSKDCPV